jgi:hypothetical protein
MRAHDGYDPGDVARPDQAKAADGITHAVPLHRKCVLFREYRGKVHRPRATHPAKVTNYGKPVSIADASRPWPRSSRPRRRHVTCGRVPHPQLPYWYHASSSPDWRLPYYQAPYGAPPTAVASYLQTRWEFCQLCSCLFYGPNNSQSICAGRMGASSPPYSHTNQDSGTFAYYLPHGSGWSGGPMQNYWNWCSQCQTLFYGPNWSKSVCPAAVKESSAFRHNTGAWQYLVPSPSA